MGPPEIGKATTSGDGRGLPEKGQPAKSTKARNSGSAQPARRTIEPIEVDKFWRDRSGRVIITRLTEYEGHRLVDIRTFFTAADGTMRPAKGLACSVRLLPNLARAIGKALAHARELGLIDGGEGGDD